MKWHRNTTRVLVVSALLIALGLVFAAYLRPDVAVTLANQLWNCL